MSTTEPVSATWQKIAECLRAELAEYGALLGLFDEQQRSLFDRQAGEVMRLSTAIEQQVRSLHGVRCNRENVVAAFASAHSQPATATLRSLLPLFDAVAQPLLAALINEVNHLIHRVRRTSRQNHTLLARTIEVHQEIIQQLRPHTFTKTYSPAGRVSLTTAHATSTLRAAG